MLEKSQAINKIDEISQQDNKLEGRSAFAVKTTDVGVVVAPVFVDKEGGLREIPNLPAVFPTRAYALEQITELTKLVNKHFDELEKGIKAGNPLINHHPRK